MPELTKQKLSPIQITDLYEDYINAGGKCRIHELFNEIILTVRKAGYEIISDDHINT